MGGEAGFELDGVCKIVLSCENCSDILNNSLRHWKTRTSVSNKEARALLNVN